MACRTIPTRVQITQVSCPEEACSCGTLVVSGRLWTYGATGTVSGPVGTRLVVNGYLTQLDCGGWTRDDIPLQGPSCVRSSAQPVQATWVGTGPGIGPGLPGDGTGCYCSDSPWLTVISALATDGVEGHANSDMTVTCP